MLSIFTESSYVKLIKYYIMKTPVGTFGFGPLLYVTKISSECGACEVKSGVCNTYQQTLGHTKTAKGDYCNRSLYRP